MLNFIIRRLLLLIPILIGVSIVTFLMVHFIPGDPARILAGQNATPEDVLAIRERFGLDKPLTVQYFMFMKALISGEVKSLRTEKNVMEEIIPRFLNTLQLSILSIIISASMGIFFGIIAGVKRNTWIDNLVMGFSLFGVSMPVFWLGILLMLLFAVKLGWLPAGGKGTWKHMILPAITLGMATSAIIARMTRANILQVFHQDYIRTAYAFGISERKIIYKYVLKNVLIPVVTIVGLQFGYLLGGAVLTESVFGWPGVGRLIAESIFTRDYTLIQVGVMFVALIFVLVNLIVDFTYAILDPRIRYGQG